MAPYARTILLYILAGFAEIGATIALAGVAVIIWGRRWF